MTVETPETVARYARIVSPEEPHPAEALEFRGASSQSPRAGSVSSSLGDHSMPRSLPIAFVMLLATPLFALGGPGSDASAAPKKPATAKPAIKGVGKHVVTKRGVPAIKLIHGTKQPASDPPTPNPPPWMAPIVTPFEGELVVTPANPTAGPVGTSTRNVDHRTFDAPWGMVAGFHFEGYGGIGLAMPAAAIGGSDLLISCEGDLPSKVSILVTTHQHPETVKRMLMELVNVDDKAKFVVMPGVLDPNMIFEVEITAQSDVAWRIDRCTIERV